MQIRDILIKDHILIICSETAKPDFTLHMYEIYCKMYGSKAFNNLLK